MCAADHLEEDKQKDYVFLLWLRQYIAMCHVLFQLCGLTRSGRGRKGFKEFIFQREDVAWEWVSLLLLKH